METITTLQKEGYKGLKVTSMLKACLCVEMREHLRLSQLNALSKIDNKYFKTGYISKPEMNLLWNVYWNFVLNDYRFDDKSKTLSTTKKVKSTTIAKHIGLQALESI
jgi:hypothetical protein